MDMSGEFRILASRETVWDALNDPEILKNCIPGCQELEKISEHELRAKLMSKVGPVKASFSTTLNLSDIDPPVRYTLSGEGKAAAAGFARGSARIELSEDGAHTILRYSAEVKVGGKLAQVGSRLVGATARKLSAQFFANLEGALASSVVADGTVTSGNG